jgi:acyl dehydratase
MIWFEDVEVGEVSRFGRYEVTREEIVEFARQWDPQPFHLDEAAARESFFGGLIASGWHTGAMFIRMVVDHAVAGAAVVGAAGFDDLRWRRPVRPGDVLSVETEVLDKTPSRRRADLGRVRVAGRVLDPRGEVVLSLVALVLYRRRPAAAGRAAPRFPSRTPTRRRSPR